MSVSEWSGTLLEWDVELAKIKDRLGPVFRRKELKETANAFLDGLLSGVERKTGWLMAEQAGHERPYRMQSLLGRSQWDAECLRDEVRAYVREALGDASGVLVIDDTGFIKKGTHSVGVHRQYSGTAGRIENCQIGVFLGYASRHGQALIDRRLYLPKAWTNEATRCQKAHVPSDIEFATKPKIACDLISDALDAGLPCAFVLGDAAYGSDSQIRRMLEARKQPYVLGVRGNHCLRFIVDKKVVQTNLEEIAEDLPPEEWSRLAAGEGSKGLRIYEWAQIDLTHHTEKTWKRWAVVRRSCQDPNQKAYYLAFTRAVTELPELAGAAGLRWTIEECFQSSKDQLGLDHCEARSWHGWHRHMSLVMAAAAFLAKLSADLRRKACSKPNKTSPNVTMAA